MVDMSQFAYDNGENEMFDSLKMKVSSNADLSEFMYFDKDTCNVLIMWGDII